MPEYDFDALLRRIATLNRRDMIYVAEQACASAETAGSYGHDYIAFEYAQRLKELLYWLRYASKPANVNPYDWSKFKSLAHHLVDLREMNPSVLNAWAPNE